MRYILKPDHREQLYREGRVEFEELLSGEELASLNALIASDLDPLDRVEAGFDLWRQQGDIARLVKRRPIAEIASDLFGTRPIRLAFDQLLLPGPFSGHAPVSIEQISPVGGVVGGLILLLEEPRAEVAGYPSRAGNGTFVRATHPISLTAPAPALLIVYCGKRPQYLYNAGAPQAHRLKKLGYVFGDLLKEESHPTLFR